MDLVFIIGAGVVFIGFVMMLFLREIPLRTMSGMQAAAAGKDDVGATGGEPPAVTGSTNEPSIAQTDTESVSANGAKHVVDGAAPAPVPASVVAAAQQSTELNGAVVGGHGGRHSVGAVNGFSPTAPDGAGAERSAMTGAEHGPNGVAGPAGNVVRGRVRQSNGAPVAEAALTLIDPSGRQAGRQITAGDGAYQRRVPTSGHYVLIARAPSHQPQAATIDVNGAAVDFDVILAGSSGLEGTVRNGAGEPVARATVTVTDAHGEVVTARTTNVAGTYSISDLVAGDYTVVVTAAGFRPTALLVSVPATGKAEQDIELTGGAHLQGVTRAGADQHPLPDARVSLIDNDGNVVAVTRTDEEGKYSFDDVPSGDYTVTATSYPPITSVVHIGTGEQQEHNIELGYPDERPARSI
jgi:hypothetical protein